MGAIKSGKRKAGTVLRESSEVTGSSPRAPYPAKRRIVEAAIADSGAVDDNKSMKKLLEVPYLILYCTLFCNMHCIYRLPSEWRKALNGMMT